MFRWLKHVLRVSNDTIWKEAFLEIRRDVVIVIITYFYLLLLLLISFIQKTFLYLGKTRSFFFHLSPVTTVTLHHITMGHATWTLILLTMLSPAIASYTTVPCTMSPNQRICSVQVEPRSAVLSNSRPPQSSSLFRLSTTINLCCTV